MMERVNGELDQETCDKLLRRELVALLDAKHQLTIHTPEEAKEIIRKQLEGIWEKFSLKKN
ncbi:MAG: hypothetical protein WC834_00010 [Eubacteriales bacterium]